MSHIASSLHDVFHRAKAEARDAAAAFTEDLHREQPFVDLTFQFIGASNLPKMDVVGTADPYFVAKLDDKLKFVSTVKPNTLSPVWNEIWKVKNVPKTATLSIDVLDKDEGNITDDHIGKIVTTVTPGAKECAIEALGAIRKDRGTLWLKIDAVPSTDRKAEQRQYVFDGPIRYSRHFSPLVGRLTNLNDARLYSTWKIFIKGVRMFFGDTVQEWNKDYKAAQSIFGPGPGSLAVRSTIQAGHRMLYARTTMNGFGLLDTPEDVIGLLRGTNGGGGPNAPPSLRRIKPAVYTYIISAEDDSFRFSETGAAFFVDFASKHALHANCAPAVRYSGEFHPRPAGGWAAFSEDVPDAQVEWELVIDNNSGTYSPDPMMLPDLQALLEYNFPTFKIIALDRQDERLVESREACRAYALNKRGVSQDELQPHAQAGEETLSHSASGHQNAPMPPNSEGVGSIGEPAEVSR